ncbi:hypothetical protein WJX74_002812 [Apatococcus lobatus]|uniref:Uncharacterized protein n=1 Tax=Apatococcus lobatus TaxID=904363 RepID=A0AAW1S600_9CHLO
MGSASVQIEAEVLHVDLDLKVGGGSAQWNIDIDMIADWDLPLTGRPCLEGLHDSQQDADALKAPSLLSIGPQQYSSYAAMQHKTCQPSKRFSQAPRLSSRHSPADQMHKSGSALDRLAAGVFRQPSSDAACSTSRVRSPSAGCPVSPASPLDCLVARTSCTVPRASQHDPPCSHMGRSWQEAVDVQDSCRACWPVEASMSRGLCTQQPCSSHAQESKRPSMAGAGNTLQGIQAILSGPQVKGVSSAGQESLHSAPFPDAHCQGLQDEPMAWLNDRPELVGRTCTTKGSVFDRVQAILADAPVPAPKPAMHQGAACEPQADQSIPAMPPCSTCDGEVKPEHASFTSHLGPYQLPEADPQGLQSQNEYLYNMWNGHPAEQGLPAIQHQQPSPVDHVSWATQAAANNSPDTSQQLPDAEAPIKQAAHNTLQGADLAAQSSVGAAAVLPLVHGFQSMAGLPMQPVSNASIDELCGTRSELSDSRTVGLVMQANAANLHDTPGDAGREKPAFQTPPGPLMQITLRGAEHQEPLAGVLCKEDTPEAESLLRSPDPEPSRALLGEADNPEVATAVLLPVAESGQENSKASSFISNWQQHDCYAVSEEHSSSPDGYLDLANCAAGKGMQQLGLQQQQPSHLKLSSQDHSKLIRSGHSSAPQQNDTSCMMECSGLSFDRQTSSISKNVGKSSHDPNEEQQAPFPSFSKDQPKHENAGSHHPTEQVTATCQGHLNEDSGARDTAITFPAGSASHARWSQAKQAVSLMTVNASYLACSERIDNTVAPAEPHEPAKQREKVAARPDGHQHHRTGTDMPARLDEHLHRSLSSPRGYLSAFWPSLPEAPIQMPSMNLEPGPLMSSDLPHQALLQPLHLSTLSTQHDKGDGSQVTIAGEQQCRSNRSTSIDGCSGIASSRSSKPSAASSSANNAGAHAASRSKPARLCRSHSRESRDADPGLNQRHEARNKARVWLGAESGSEQHTLYSNEDALTALHSSEDVGSPRSGQLETQSKQDEAEAVAGTAETSSADNKASSCQPERVNCCGQGLESLAVPALTPSSNQNKDPHIQHTVLSDDNDTPGSEAMPRQPTSTEDAEDVLCSSHAPSQQGSSHQAEHQAEQLCRASDSFSLKSETQPAHRHASNVDQQRDGQQVAHEGEQASSTTDVSSKGHPQPARLSIGSSEASGLPQSRRASDVAYMKDMSPRMVNMMEVGLASSSSTDAEAGSTAPAGQIEGIRDRLVGLDSEAFSPRTDKSQPAAQITSPPELASSIQPGPTATSEQNASLTDDEEQLSQDLVELAQPSHLTYHDIPQSICSSLMKVDVNDVLDQPDAEQPRRTPSKQGRQTSSSSCDAATVGKLSQLLQQIGIGTTPVIQLVREATVDQLGSSSSAPAPSSTSTEMGRPKSQSSKVLPQSGIGDDAPNLRFASSHSRHAQAKMGSDVVADDAQGADADALPESRIASSVSPEMVLGTISGAADSKLAPTCRPQHMLQDQNDLVDDSSMHASATVPSTVHLLSQPHVQARISATPSVSDNGLQQPLDQQCSNESCSPLAQQPAFITSQNQHRKTKDSAMSGSAIASLLVRIDKLAGGDAAAASDLGSDSRATAISFGPGGQGGSKPDARGTQLHPSSSSIACPEDPMPACRPSSLLPEASLSSTAWDSPQKGHAPGTPSAWATIHKHEVKLAERPEVTDAAQPAGAMALPDSRVNSSLDTDSSSLRCGTDNGKAAAESAREQRVPCTSGFPPQLSNILIGPSQQPAASSLLEPLPTSYNEQATSLDMANQPETYNMQESCLRQLQSCKAPSCAGLITRAAPESGCRAGSSQPCITITHCWQPGLPKVELQSFHADGRDVDNLNCKDMHVGSGLHDAAHTAVRYPASTPRAALDTDVQTQEPPLLHGLDAWMQSNQDLMTHLQLLSATSSSEATSANAAASASDVADGSGYTGFNPALGSTLRGSLRTAAGSFGGMPQLLDLADWMHSQQTLPSRLQNLGNRKPSQSCGTPVAACSLPEMPGASSVCLQQASLLPQESHALMAASTKPILQASSQQDWRWLISDLQFTQQALLAWARLQAPPGCMPAGPCQHMASVEEVAVLDLSCGPMPWRKPSQAQRCGVDTACIAACVAVGFMGLHICRPSLGALLVMPGCWLELMGHTERPLHLRRWHAGMIPR